MFPCFQRGGWRGRDGARLGKVNTIVFYFESLPVSTENKSVLAFAIVHLVSLFLCGGALAAFHSNVSAPITWRFTTGLTVLKPPTTSELLYGLSRCNCTGVILHTGIRYIGSRPSLQIECATLCRVCFSDTGGGYGDRVTVAFPLLLSFHFVWQKRDTC